MKALKRFLWAVAGLLVAACIAVGMAAMWAIGQLPH